MILKNSIGLAMLHLCAATEPGRYAMHNIHSKRLENGKMRCAATNGRILARVDLDAAEEDVDGFLSTEAWQAGLKSASNQRPPEIHANGSIAVRNKANTATTHYDRPADGEFPRIEAVIPKGYEDAANPHFVRFTFNPEYLIAAAKAIGQNEGSPCITVHIQTETYRDLEPCLDEKGEQRFEQIPDCYPGTETQAIDLEGNPKWKNGAPLMRPGGEIKFRQMKNVPLVVTNGDPDAVAVVMPITVD